MISRYEKLSAAVAEISRLIGKISADVMREYGLRGSWAKYLLAMRKHGAPITAARLCKICDRDKADTSRFFTEVEKTGLIEKVSGGHYRVRMRLSEEGVRIADSISERAGAIIAFVGKDITEETRSVLYSSLDSIAENLRHLSDGSIQTI